MLATQKQSLTSADNVREFEFPRGIAGFPGATRFAFIYEGKGNMLCLQSINQPEASFILTLWDESRLGEPPKISAEQMDCMHISDAQDVQWFVVLNPFADATWVTANLKAPIAISADKQTGLQCILNQKDLDLRYRWMKQPQA